MKTKTLAAGILAAIILCVVGWTGFAQRQQSSRGPGQTAWEYKVVYAPGARNLSEKAMNEMGAQGWELVTFQALNNEGGTIGAGNYFFKRARAAQP
jgi:hypothetical protein